MSARRRLLPHVLAGVTTAALAASAPAHAAAGPDLIGLPVGWQPEGISQGGGALFAGSIATGAVYRADARTGAGSVLVSPKQGRAAIGIKQSRGLLWVAGGGTGHAYVYDARTGADVADLTLTAAPTFLNDVVLTRSAAWFTDSVNQRLYRVPRDRSGAPSGPPVTVPITGDFQYDADPGTFEANGIVSGEDGALLVVQTRTGGLFRINHKTGASTRVDLDGGSVPNGDGMLLRGRTLYVVQNTLNRIAIVKLDAGLRSGRVAGTLTDPDLDVPTTITKRGDSLYAVNARFGTPSPAEATYAIVRLDLGSRDDD